MLTAGPHSTRRKGARVRSIVPRVAACAAGLFLFVLAPGLAHAASDQHLLATYQPVTILDPLEQFQPTAVHEFVQDADLEQLQSNSWVVVNNDPDLDELPGPGTGVWRLNQDPCTPAMPVGGLACYAAAEQGGRSTVYGRVAHVDAAIVLQYWYFYYDDVYSYTYPPSDLIWQAHEGDWEVVNVVLSADETPLYVGYSQHCLGERRDWAATPRHDTHPIVHVAIGSHANEFAAGTHLTNTACIPDPVIDWLVANGYSLPVDYAGEGEVAGPSEAGGIVTRIRELTADDPPTWLAFPGRWGEDQYFHAAPLSTRAFAFGVSPTGPAQHSIWSDPLGTLAGWPPG